MDREAEQREWSSSVLTVSLLSRGLKMLLMRRKEPLNASPSEERKEDERCDDGGVEAGAEAGSGASAGTAAELAPLLLSATLSSRSTSC